MFKDQEGERERERKEERKKERREGGNENQWAYWDGEQWIKVKTLYLVFLLFYSLFLSLFFSLSRPLISLFSIFFFFFSFLLNWSDYRRHLFVKTKNTFSVIRKTLLSPSLSDSHPKLLNHWRSKKRGNFVWKKGERETEEEEGKWHSMFEDGEKKYDWYDFWHSDKWTVFFFPSFSILHTFSWARISSHSFLLLLFSFSFSYVWFNLRLLLNHRSYKYWQ